MLFRVKSAHCLLLHIRLYRNVASIRVIHLKKKIDTDHCSISNIFISLHIAEAENQKVSGMHIAMHIFIRPNCPN